MPSVVDEDDRPVIPPGEAGAPFKLTPKMVRAALVGIASRRGASVEEIAVGLNIDRHTVYRDLRLYDEMIEKLARS